MKESPWKSTIYKLSHLGRFCSFQFPISNKIALAPPSAAFPNGRTWSTRPRSRRTCPAASWAVLCCGPTAKCSLGPPVWAMGFKQQKRWIHGMFMEDQWNVNGIRWEFHGIQWDFDWSLTEVFDWFEWENGDLEQQSIVTNTMAGAKLWLELFLLEQQKELRVCFFDQQEWLKQRFRQKKWVFGTCRIWFWPRTNWI